MWNSEQVKGNLTSGYLAGKGGPTLPLLLYYNTRESTASGVAFQGAVQQKQAFATKFMLLMKEKGHLIRLGSSGVLDVAGLLFGVPCLLEQTMISSRPPKSHGKRKPIGVQKMYWGFCTTSFTV